MFIHRQMDSSATATGKLFALNSRALRQTIVNIYKKTYEDDTEPWYNHLYAHLIGHLRDIYSDYSKYASVVEALPLTSINMILQPNLINDDHYLFDDNFIYAWAASNWWCRPEKELIRRSLGIVLTGGGPFGSMSLSASEGDTTVTVGNLGYNGESTNLDGITGLLSGLPGFRTHSLPHEKVLPPAFKYDKAVDFPSDSHNYIYEYNKAPSQASMLINGAKNTIRRKISSGEIREGDLAPQIETLYELVRSIRQENGLYTHIYRSVGTDSHLVDLYKDVAMYLEKNKLAGSLGMSQYEYLTQTILSSYKNLLIRCKQHLTKEQYDSLIASLLDETSKHSIKSAIFQIYNRVAKEGRPLSESLGMLGKYVSDAVKDAKQSGGKRKTKRKSRR